MNQPLVSIVMPSYNHKEFVGKAIESVLNQTYKNFEFIIADDGSTDSSVEIISQYDDPRIKFVRFEENTGFGAYEYGLELAEGEYIATIASDDMWEHTLIETYIEFMENNKEYGCCFSQPQIIDENDTIVENSKYDIVFRTENRTKEEWFRHLYLIGNCICAPSMCIRKEVYQQIGPFRFQYRQSQDYEYWLRLVQKYEIYICPEKLVKYRIHNQGDNRNISAVTGETLVRGRMEQKHTLLQMMEEIDDEFFLKAFSEDFILKLDMEGFCVECEKFGILLKNPVVDPAIYYYYKHYNDKNFRECLETYYHVSRKEFWQLTGADHDHYYENIRNKCRVDELTKQIELLKQELSAKEEEISRLKNS